MELTYRRHRAHVLSFSSLGGETGCTSGRASSKQLPSPSLLDADSEPPCSCAIPNEIEGLIGYVKTMVKRFPEYSFDVKKIFADGTPCKKCREVSERMDAEGVFEHINQVAIADERDPDSEGMKLARQHQVSRAPFFIVEQQGLVDVFDVYFNFKKF